MKKLLPYIYRNILFALVFVGIGFAFTIQKAELRVYDCAEANTSFLDGEQLVYKVYYNWQFLWVPAGEVTFDVEESDDEYIYTSIGKSYPSYNYFFRVNDFYQAKINKQTMLPNTFVRYIEEGKYRQFDSLYFDHAHEKVLSINGKTKEVAKQTTHEIDKCALDMLSVMYALRNTKVENYSAGDFLDITMFLDREVYPIKVVYKGEEQKKIRNLGNFNTIKISPELVVGNVFKKGDVMNIWVSKDQNKIPLLIESPISVGSVKAVLKSFKGLRSTSVLDQK